MSLTLKSDEIWVALTPIDFRKGVNGLCALVQAKALAANTTLTSLNVRFNQIGAEGAKALAANSTLTSLLNMRGNKIGDDWQKTLTQKITHNRQEVVKRRDRFIQAMLTLARDSANPHSRSTWHILPKDIQSHILSFVSSTLSASLGKTPQQAQQCIDFVFTHIDQLQEALTVATLTRQGFKVMEKRVRGTSQFCFFPSSSDQQAKLAQKGNTNGRKDSKKSMKEEPKESSKCLIQ